MLDFSVLRGCLKSHKGRRKRNWIIQIIFQNHGRWILSLRKTHTIFQNYRIDHPDLGERKLHPKISGADDQEECFLRSDSPTIEMTQTVPCSFFWGGGSTRPLIIVCFYLLLLPSRPRKKTNANQQNKFSSKTNIPRGKKIISLNKFPSLGRFFLVRTTILWAKGAPEWSRIDPSPNSVASNAQDLQCQGDVWNRNPGPGGWVFLPGWRFGVFVGKKHIDPRRSFEVDGKMGLNAKSSLA